MDFESTDNIKSEMLEIILKESSRAAGKRIVELHMPATATILAIKRSAVFIAPNGSTKLLANDTLYVLAEDKKALELLGESLDISI